MKLEKMKSRIVELQVERSKLIKVKSASPMDIINRTKKITEEIAKLELEMKSHEVS